MGPLLQVDASSRFSVHGLLIPVGEIGSWVTLISPNG